MDLVYERLSDKWKARGISFGMVFLLSALCRIDLLPEPDFVHEAWRLGEGSVAPMGLAAGGQSRRLIPLAFAMVILATLSRIVRTLSILRRL